MVVNPSRLILTLPNLGGGRLNIKKLQITLAAHFYLEAIDGIYEASLDTKNRLKTQLAQRVEEIESDKTLDSEEKNYLLHTFGDDFYMAEITTNLAGEMMIVALYKTIEIAIKEMARTSGLFTPPQLQVLFRVADLKKNFKKKVCDLETLPNYDAFNELRCINNAIKHSGRVGVELARYSSFTQGQILSGLHEHYFRLRDNVNIFVNSLATKIKAAIS
jgi:hypothetical protein